MDLLEFAAKMTEAVIWPVSIASAAFVMYRTRGKGGKFFAEFFRRLKELNLGSFKVILTESNSVQTLSADIKTAHYKRYTNGMVVQQMRFGMTRGMEITLVFPMAFPNEVLSFQFVGCTPLPIKSVTNANFVLDAKDYPGSIQFDLIVTGM